LPIGSSPPSSPDLDIDNWVRLVTCLISIVSESCSSEIKHVIVLWRCESAFSCIDSRVTCQNINAYFEFHPLAQLHLVVEYLIHDHYDSFNFGK